MIAHGLPIFVALEPVDMRLGAERLGALVRGNSSRSPVLTAGSDHVLVG